MKILLTAAFIPVAIITLAQSSSRRKWEVTAVLTRTISKVTDLTGSSQCPQVTQKGLDQNSAQFSLHVNNAKEVLNGGGLEVDWEGATSEGPASINGNYTNTESLVVTNTYNCPNDCKQVIVKKNSSANGKPVRDASVFGFFYDPEKKQGNCNLTGTFEFTGTSVMARNDCHTSYELSSPQMDAGYASDVASLQYCKVDAYSYDPYLDEGYDAPTRQKFYKVDRMLGKGGTARITQVGDGYEISYSYTVTDTMAAEGEDRGGWYTTFTTTLNASIRPQLKYKAIIEPVGGWTIYKQWLPEGNIEDEQRKPGNHTGFRIKIINTEQPSATAGVEIKEVNYKLNDISRLPGVCMNYPSKNPDAKMDYSLVDGLKAKLGPQPDEVSELTLPYAQALIVNSYDFGGFARLTARVKLVNGEELVASNEEDGSNYINIPYRREGDYVSQAWKEQMNVDGVADDNDDEAAGNGVGEQYKGDGYTLFEEYRGFRENGKHIRTLPKEMDLMVLNLVNPKNRAQDGINLFSSVTGIVTHSRFREEEFGRNKEEPGLKSAAASYKTKGIDHDKVLNFNFLQQAHAVDQHGILLLSTDTAMKQSLAVPKTEAHWESPKDNFFVVISGDFKPGPEGFFTTRGSIDASGNVTANPTGPAKIVTDRYAQSLAHEILHTCGVKHHGDGDIGGVQLQYQNNSYQAYINGSFRPITLRRNDAAGTVLTNAAQDADYLRLYFPRFATEGMGVAVQGGQHSGMEDCIMRYAAASSFFSEDRNTLYLLEPGHPSALSSAKDLNYELAGIQLCGSPKGTGVNDKNAKPRPRYGDATKGNCRSQVRLNDK